MLQRPKCCQLARAFLAVDRSSPTAAIGPLPIMGRQPAASFCVKWWINPMMGGILRRTSDSVVACMILALSKLPTPQPQSSAENVSPDWFDRPGLFHGSVRLSAASLDNGAECRECHRYCDNSRDCPFLPVRDRLQNRATADQHDNAESQQDREEGKGRAQPPASCQIVIEEKIKGSRAVSEMTPPARYTDRC